jgi:transposase
MKPDLYIDCLEPGADNPKKHAPVPAPEPPEGFIDNTVYRYKLDEDGNKVLIGTMEAFPEGWDHPQQFREKGFKKQKEDEAMVKPLENREELIRRAKALMQDGLSLTKAAKEVGIGTSTLSVWLKKERQAANQEPEREEAESAGTSLTQEKPEFTVKDVNQKLQYELAQREQGFGPEDEEPIPYVPVSLEKMVIELRDDLNLERHKVAALEKKMELLASALPAGSRTSQESRLAKLLVAVFRELGDAGTA